MAGGWVQHAPRPPAPVVISLPCAAARPGQPRRLTLLSTCVHAHVRIPRRLAAPPFRGPDAPRQPEWLARTPPAQRASLRALPPITVTTRCTSERRAAPAENLRGFPAEEAEEEEAAAAAAAAAEAEAEGQEGQEGQ